MSGAFFLHGGVGLISGAGIIAAITALPLSKKGTFTWTLCIRTQRSPWRADTDTGSVPSNSTVRSHTVLLEGALGTAALIFYSIFSSGLQKLW